jgi:beta-galactosidase
VEERRTSFDPGGLILGDGRRLDLFAAELHYWRVQPSAWGACLRAVKALGFEIVSTYVPWSVHERAPGRYDFGGGKDLGGFLDACQREGLFAIVKPGPHVNAELTGFGYPERVLADPDMQARTARGTPMWMPAPPRMFPVPSYAAPRFQAAASEWLAAVGAIVAPRRFPDGPVVAAQVDNEMQSFFRLGAFDGDYHEGALAWWREESGAAEAPRGWADDLSGALAWVRFKERYGERALGWVAAAMEAGGFGGLARYHNAPPSEPHLTNLPRLGRGAGGPAGLDFYLTASAYHRVRRRALYLGGTGDPLPFAPEVGLGGPPWLPPMTAADQAAVTLGVLAGGARAMTFFMVVDRERWYGAPVGGDGALRPPAEWLRTLLATLRKVGWTGLRRRAPVALVLGRAESRAATATSLADPLTPVVTELLDLGPGGAAELGRDPAAVAHRRWFAALERALAAAAVPYDIVDEDAADRLAGYRAVLAPTIERIDRHLLATLRTLAAGGTTVVLGPGRPSRDELDRPLDDASLPRPCGLLDAAALDDDDALIDAVLALAGELDADFIAEGQPVDCSLFEDQSGVPRVLLVGNRDGSAGEARVALPAGVRLGDPFGGAAPVRGGVATVALVPHGVRLFTVEH